MGLAAPEEGSVQWRDGRLILLGALALVALVVLTERVWALQPLRIALGLACVLYVPGYCLAAALFPRRDDLDTPERHALSVGLSVAIVPVLALVLDWLPWGIRLWPILVGEYGLMALFLVVARWRRSRLAAEVVYAPQLVWRPGRWWAGLSRQEGVTYGLVAGLLVAAFLAAGWVLLVPSPDQFVTEFYVLGREGLAEDYPRAASVGEVLTITAGIANRERGEYTYRYQVWATDPWDPSQRALLAEGGPITLAPGQSQEWPLSWRMSRAADDQQVEILLFVGEAPEPYRQLRLWLNVTEPRRGR